MSTKFAALNAYPMFSTPPRLCGLSAFPMAPRQNHRFSLPRVEVLVETSDDSDDEGTLLSYHSMRLKRARAPSPDNVDDLEKRKLVSHEATMPKKKPTDTTNKWDYYLSDLSDLTESDASDSDDEVQSKPTIETRDNESPRSKPQVGLITPSITNVCPPSQLPSSGLKRKRSYDSGMTSTATSDTASAVKDSEGPSKRRRRTSGKSETSEAAEKNKESSSSSSSTTASKPVLSMSPEEIKKSIRRYGKTFGTVRKPRLMRGASLRQREMGTRS